MIELILISSWNTFFPTYFWCIILILLLPHCILFDFIDGSSSSSSWLLSFRQYWSQCSELFSFTYMYILGNMIIFSSVQFSCSFLPESLQSHGLWHSRLPCPSPTPRACLNSCPLSQWCHPTISISVIPFSSHLQSFPVSGTLPISQFFPSGGQSIGASALVLPKNIQDWFPSEWTG